VLTTFSLGSNYRTSEDHQIPLPVSEPVTPLLTEIAKVIEAEDGLVQNMRLEP
jgi:hypothetical protein